MGAGSATTRSRRQAGPPPLAIDLADVDHSTRRRPFRQDVAPANPSRGVSRARRDDQGRLAVGRLTSWALNT